MIFPILAGLLIAGLIADAVASSDADQDLDEDLDREDDQEVEDDDSDDGDLDELADDGIAFFDMPARTVPVDGRPLTAEEQDSWQTIVHASTREPRRADKAGGRGGRREQRGWWSRTWGRLMAVGRRVVSWVRRNIRSVLAVLADVLDLWRPGSNTAATARIVVTSNLLA